MINIETKLESHNEIELKEQILSVIPQSVKDDEDFYLDITIASKCGMLVECAPMGFIMYFWFGDVSDVERDIKETLIYSTNEMDHEVVNGSIPEAFANWLKEL